MLRIREGSGEGASITIFCHKFLSHNAEDFRRETLMCFRKLQLLEKFLPLRGISRFSIKSLLSHSTEKLRRGTFLCFAIYLVSKTFMDKRGERYGWEYHVFVSHFLYLTVPIRGITLFFTENLLSHTMEKNRRGTFLCFKNFLVPENFRGKRGGGSHQFPSKLFCLPVPNQFVEKPLCVSESFGYRSFFMPIKGISRISNENLLSHSPEKLRRGTLLCFTKLHVSEKFKD